VSLAAISTLRLGEVASRWAGEMGSVLGVRLAARPREMLLTLLGNSYNRVPPDRRIGKGRR
jgi:hypothetical protein